MGLGQASGRSVQGRGGGVIAEPGRCGETGRGVHTEVLHAPLYSKRTCCPPCPPPSGTTGQVFMPKTRPLSHPSPVPKAGPGCLSCAPKQSLPGNVSKAAIPVTGHSR